MLEEIVERLKKLGYPVAENSFRKTKKEPPPEPPYIVWFCAKQTGRGADCVNNIRERRVAIELYTDKRAAKERKELAKRIEDEVLFCLEYERFETEIESEELMQTAYEFEMVEKGEWK